jgi:uncharacterized repeat protein (TIGR03803 family)
MILVQRIKTHRSYPRSTRTPISIYVSRRESNGRRRRGKSGYACVLAATLAACGESQPAPISNSAQAGAAQSARNGTSSYRLLYSFPDNGDVYSWDPESSLTYVNGSFYGTTYRNGSYGGGTLFALDAQGTLRIVHSFRRGSDGFRPIAGVTELNGTLYGTTAYGGTECAGRPHCAGDGVIYRVLPPGSDYKVLYRFTGASDGAVPSPGGLIVLDGTLYGTTEGYSEATSQCSSSGGGCGTVFSITPSGKLRTIYAFKGGADGYEPMGVVALHGTLYGTTLLGGKYACPYSIACGTIFSVTTSGVKHTLHNFSAKDGIWPEAGLTVLRGALYGVTSRGGIAARCIYYISRGCGTIFEMSTSGKYHVLHRLQMSDGTTPFAALLAFRGILYGVTQYGSSATAPGGTIFSITPSGKLTVRHDFEGAPTDGAEPIAALTNHDGTLYGTTQGGGAANRGAIFSFTP